MAPLPSTRRTLALGAVALVASGVHGAERGSFQPFAEVQELAPSDLEGFCGVRDPRTGLAKCERAIRKKLHDGGDVELGWRMEVDPESIVSLDLEGDRGAVATKCGPGELEVSMPQAIAKRARPGALVVGSRFSHGCKHLEGRVLYSRVAAVKRADWHGCDAATSSCRLHAQLNVEEMPTIAHALPSMAFNFSYVPAEARDIVPYPELRTDFGQHRPDAGRRLEGISKIDGLLRLVPKQISNFGWNWNFFMNTTDNPEFNYTLPGIQGYMKLKQPFIKIHAGIFLNFSSHFHSVMKTPHVDWKLGFNSHGVVNARMLTDVKTTSEITEDPFHLFEIPVLEQLKDTLWFDKIDFAAGQMPLAVEPGFEFRAKMYHTGIFDGTLQLGGKTHFILNPVIHFDSDKGMETVVHADFKDTDLYPPLWIVSTKHFEMGVALEPVVWLRGQFNEVQNTKVGFEVRPYLNLTISRDAETAIVSKDMKTLVAYPFRVVGIDGVEMDKKYKVKVAFNGDEYETSAELNWGQVEFRDHVSGFICGSVPQKAVLTQPVKVTLIEVTDGAYGGGEKELGKTEVTCRSMLNGECQPSPTIANIDVDGKTVSVELAIIWQDNPIPWFASKIRGVSLSFPKVTLRDDVVQKTAPELADAGAKPDPLTLRVTHAGRSYVSDVSGFTPGSAGASPPLQGTRALELGPTFLESWMPCPIPGCESGKLELFYGSKRIGVNDLPEIPWNTVIPQPTASDSLLSESINADNTEVSEGAKSLAILLGAMAGGKKESASVEDKEPSFNNILKSAMMSAMNNAEATAAEVTNVPKDIAVSVALMPPEGGDAPIAVVNVKAKVSDPTHSSMFFSPSTSEKVQISGTKNFVWTIAYVTPGISYDFRLTPWKLVDVASAGGKASPYPGAGDKSLQQVLGGETAIAAECKRTELDGMGFGATPCSFSYPYTFSTSQYAAHDEVILMIEWLADGLDHVMLSPPMVIMPEGGMMGRRLWTPEDWDARLAANKESCQVKDLHFEVGFGMMERARLTGPYSALMPLISGEIPGISTEFKQIGSEDMADQNLQSMLPSWLCSDGVCKGKMPGCTDANFEIMHFPELLFNFNRDFKYADIDGGGAMIKEILAYAFSTMPEAVEVLIKKLNETKSTTVAPTALPFQWPGSPAAGWSSRASAVGTTTPQPVDWTGFPVNVGGASIGHRLLRALGTDESAGPSPSHQALEGRQVVMRFRHGVHYRVDRPLVEMMMRHGMFQQLEDDLTKTHGPAFITDFEVRGGEPVKIHDSFGAGPLVWLLGIPAAIVLAIVVSVAMTRRRAYQPVEEPSEKLAEGVLDGAE